MENLDHRYKPITLAQAKERFFWNCRWRTIQEGSFFYEFRINNKSIDLICIKGNTKKYIASKRKSID